QDGPREAPPIARRPVAPPAPPSPSVTRSAPTEGGDEAAPDTGAWRLGDGGIRFEDAAPAQPAAPQPPQQRAPQRPVEESTDTDPEGKRAAGNRDQEISVQDLLRRAREQGGQGQ
ncbi:MAG: RND transporter, partial [Gordonia sp. (in: high G+C Gram-positive bacteria)]